MHYIGIFVPFACPEQRLVLSLRKAPTWRCLWWLDGALAASWLLMVMRLPQECKRRVMDEGDRAEDGMMSDDE